MKRCSGICLLVGTSGKGLGLTLEPVQRTKPKDVGEELIRKRPGCVCWGFKIEIG